MSMYRIEDDVINIKLRLNNPSVRGSVIFLSCLHFQFLCNKSKSSTNARLVTPLTDERDDD